MMTARKPEAFIFDLDGTIYLGDKIIPGAKETLQWLREKELKIRFVTNNPRYSSSFYTNKLNRLGIEAQECEVINSAQLTAQYIKNNPKYGKIFVIGEDPLKKELAAKYIPMVKDGHPDTVLVSFDTMLTYEKLQFAYQSLKNGSNFIATNPDAVCPTPGGGLVDAGAIIAALEAATGRKVERVIGKPSELMADLVVKQLNVTPD